MIKATVLSSTIRIAAMLMSSQQEELSNIASKVASEMITEFLTPMVSIRKSGCTKEQLIEELERRMGAEFDKTSSAMSALDQDILSFLEACRMSFTSMDTTQDPRELVMRVVDWGYSVPSELLNDPKGLETSLLETGLPGIGR